MLGKARMHRYGVVKGEQIVKKIYALLMVSLLMLTVACAPQSAKQEEKKEDKPTTGQEVLLASTIGPIDSGIVAALEEAFRQKTGIVVRHVGAGTGATLKLAESGKFDVVMVHAKDLEEKFVADGFGVKRYDLMYNDFVLLGPADDPAKVKGEATINAALQKLAAAGVPFVTRGDKSGTHIKELELWQAAGIKPGGGWYKVFVQGSEGNAKTLRYADEQKAYTIMDRATYITMKNDLKLQVLVEKDEALLNYITMIPVNPAKFPSVKSAESMKFIEWLVSEEGQKIIRDYGKDKYGEPLFFPNSAAGKALAK